MHFLMYAAKPGIFTGFPFSGVFPPMYLRSQEGVFCSLGDSWSCHKMVLMLWLVERGYICHLDGKRLTWLHTGQAQSQKL